MLTLSRVGGSPKKQNAYGCLRCQGWVGLKKNKMLTDAYVVVEGGSEKIKRVLIFIKRK